GVAPGYYAGALERHRHLQAVPRLGVPYGAGVEDYAYVEQTARRSQLLDFVASDRLGLVYARAIFPRRLDTLRTVFEGCRRLRAARPELGARLQILFVGTGVKTGGALQSLVAPLAAEAGVTDIVTEIGERQPYLEVLATLARSQGIL